MNVGQKHNGFANNYPQYPPVYKEGSGGGNKASPEVDAAFFRFYSTFP